MADNASVDVLSTPKTGVVYDTDMTQHYCTWDPNYPECPNRLTCILKRCEQLSLIERCKKLPSRKATRDELLFHHSSDLISLLEKCETKNEEELEEISSNFDAIYICTKTYHNALLSAGNTINLIRGICENEVINGMGIIRPPGHHATKSEYCGYCFFNNVAIAAQYALDNYNLTRILIVDWDVHHGQGTQQMFYKDKRVLYFSIHRFEHGTFWPNLRESDCDFVGEGPGEGYNFNMPLNKTGLGNADYLAIFHHVLLPVAVEFQPELIIVSAGYDAAIGCPEGKMRLTPACYAHFINALGVLASGNIAVILEGGYFLNSLAEGAALTLRALLGDPCPDIGSVGPVDESVKETISNLIYYQKQFWKCFQLYEEYSHIDFNPTNRYDWEEVQYDKFETRNCYPVPSEEMRIQNLKVLNDLQENTDLHTPEFTSYLVSSIVLNNENEIHSMFDRFGGKTCQIDSHSVNEENIRDIFKYVFDKRTRSLVLDGNTFIADKTPFGIVSKSLTNYLKSKRILFVNFHHDNHTIANDLRNEENSLLYFSFNKENKLHTECANECTNFSWNDTNWGNVEYVTVWLKIMLPISYQFNPEITIILLNLNCFSAKNPTTNDISSEVFGYLIRWLMAFANGKTILMVNRNPDDATHTSYLTNCCKALLNCPLTSLRTNNRRTNSAIDDILKLTVERCSKRWSNIDFSL